MNKKSAFSIQTIVKRIFIKIRKLKLYERAFKKMCVYAAILTDLTVSRFLFEAVKNGLTVSRFFFASSRRKENRVTFGNSKRNAQGGRGRFLKKAPQKLSGLVRWKPKKSGRKLYTLCANVFASTFNFHSDE